MPARSFPLPARRTFIAAALVAGLSAPVVGVAAPEAPQGDGVVQFIVVRENGSGSAAAAQSYLDAFLASVAARNGWSGAAGKYFTSRSKASKHVAEVKPSFGFFSFGAYLGMRKANDLVPLGVADASASGGSQYYVISKNAFTLDGCKGKTLATNHASDEQFVDAIVSGDAFDLADFQVVATKRPVQTIKAVIGGEAECALIDDSQITALGSIEGGALLRPVWASEALPAVVVVSFGSAPTELRDGFAKTLEQVCEGEGRATCDAAGLEKPRRVEATAFAAQQAAYDG